MSKKKLSYTEEQKQVINEVGKNILVSAAAGSGKTAVLVRRILRILKEEKIPITDMLIVTFTNAAAGEMRERIQREILREIEEDPNESGFLQEQMSRMGEASISTLHSFCIDVLREYFHFLNISPSFKIATEANASILRSQAMEEVLERYYEEGAEDFFHLMDAYGGEKSDRDFVELIDKLFHFLQGQSEPWEWLEEKTEFFNFDLLHFLRSELFLYYIESLLSELKIAEGSAREALQVCVEQDIPYRENLEEDLRMISTLKRETEQYLSRLECLNSQEDALSAAKAYDELSEKIRESSFGRLKTISKKRKEEDGLDEEILNEIKEIRNSEIKERMKKLKSETGSARVEDFHEEILSFRDSMSLLHRFVKDYHLVYQTKKKELELVDFSDLEHFALKLLKESEVQAALREKFRYIFFDEYQDSNSVQETIVEGIRRKNNLFFVGDIKQSIYGFRLAEPKLFQRRYRAYEEGEEGRSLKIDLSKNFRSRREILDFCNDVFYSLMTEERGDIDYRQEGQALTAGADFSPSEKSVELLLGEKAKEESISHHIIANRILELEGQSGGKDGSPLSFRDMVILMRSPKSSVKDLEKVLKSYDIPCYVDYSSVGFDVVEIRSLLEYLRVIDNEMNDEALLGAMLSYFGGFDEMELAEIRSSDKGGSFYRAVKRYAFFEEEDLEEAVETRNELTEKIRGFFEGLSEWRRREKLLSLSDFLFELLTETGYFNYQTLLEKGEERTENLKGFLNKAQEYEADGRVGLFGFLRYVDKILKDRGDTLEAMGISDTANVVRIMSIHKSKGLEFPVVFLTDLHRNFYFADNKEAFVLHNELGIGARYVDLQTSTYRDGFVKKMIQKKKKKELLSEEVRILYVGMTRAVDKLILVGETKDVKASLQQAYSGSLEEKLHRGNSYLAWLIPVLIRQRKNRTLRMLADLVPEEGKLLEGNSECFVNITGQEEITRGDSTEKEKSETIAEFLSQEGEEERRAEIRALFEERFGYTYPFEEEVSLPYKKGVSKLIREERQKNRDKREEIQRPEEDGGDIELEESPLLPKFMAKERKMEASEMGSVLHFIVQSLELRPQTRAEVEEKIKDMVERELLTEQEKSQVDMSWIMGFLNSRMGERLFHAEEVHRERPFMMKHENYLLEGIIDCYFFEGDKLILIDFKTDRRMDGERHRRQMELYAEALEKNYHRKVDEVHIFWLRYGKSSRLW